MSPRRSPRLKGISPAPMGPGPKPQPPKRVPPQLTVEEWQLRQLVRPPDRGWSRSRSCAAQPEQERETQSAFSTCASRVPASAGARYLRGRRHLPLLGHRRRDKQAKIDDGCASRAPHPPCTQDPTSTPPAPTHRSRTFPPPCTAHAPALHASLAPDPLLPSCAQELEFACSPDKGRGWRSPQRGDAAAAGRPAWAGGAARG